MYSTMNNSNLLFVYQSNDYNYFNEKINTKFGSIVVIFKLIIVLFIFLLFPFSFFSIFSLSLSLPLVINNPNKIKKKIINIT